MNKKTNTPVAVVGLGLMGRALAGAFLRSGYPTIVWNRTSSKADSLVSQGAQLAPSVDAAMKAGTVIVICLTDDAAVQGVLGTDGPDLGGALLVNLTSSDSAAARHVAELAEKRGARYLDGAIMAVPPTIGTAEAEILLSGPESDFASHQQILGALGTVTHVGTDPGLAALYETAGLVMMWGILNAWLHGTAMLRTAGVDAAAYAPFAQQIAAVVSQWLPGYAEQVDRGTFPAEVSALETDARAMTHLIKESEAIGVNAELPKLIKEMADRAIAAGHGAEQYPVLIEEFGRP